MKYKILFVFFVFFGLFNSCKSEYQYDDALRFIDPQIGGVAPLLKPTKTRMHIPNAMVRVNPERKDYRDDQIRSFPLTAYNHRGDGIFNFLPVSGNLPLNKEPISAWDQELEQASPFYYSTWLEDFDITLEYAPGEKAGFYRFNYKNAKDKKVFLKDLNGTDWQLNAEGDLVGDLVFKEMKAYAYVKLDVPATLSQVKVSPQGVNTWLTWADASPQQINMKYGISYISLEQAKRNLSNEIPDWDFEKVKANARKQWQNLTNLIQVEGGTEANKRSFYTALYRSSERMVNISEEQKYYSSYDKKVHTDSKNFYVDDAIWDTFLAVHPLRTIFNPQMESDMISSYVRMFEQWGWMPQFPQVHGETVPMNGFHSTIMVLDAYRKGLKNIDYEKAYEGMKKNALQQTMVPWRSDVACELDQFYAEKGYFPALRPGEVETVPLVHPFEKRQAVAVTLAHSYDDWALAQMALELGKKEDYQYFLARATNYKNLYWKEKGFFMPKDKDGNWIDIDPKFDGGMGGRDYYDENNGWTYLWNVQQDIPGLQKLMGGKTVFKDRLDQLFREDLGRSNYELYAKFPDFTGIVGQFSMGNQPSFHIPYLYNFTDSPWKTQKKIRMLLNTWFKDNIFGMPGDEDGGATSAFVVFSAMGFYPITPGLPIYTIGSPWFTKSTLQLPEGKKFIISAPKCSETNKYIQSAKLNGKTLDGPWFTHNDIVKGGILELEMGAYPNKEWGSDPKSIPAIF
ncbi:GH92 family glycosyl hydrolase [Flavobacterium nackdongense]|uniref:Glycoside hydrolase family 92 protein n=1 Tax=Flavobacterium nackdongense TaxID=2547394 RepID=A0A4P6Y9X2_9FLAO|nr:GH92 family glycosyl hydrolase [Flavobacterium nackdongense]QBN17425.1 glycoside hydrolase family 92 protein [Flavobacterium nackdongense]